MATAIHEPMTRAPIDLDRLNDAERRVLRLLAEGHTAKSIANAIGSTPAAVNERLREARRKTSVGSSRELARQLRAQEKRHEQIRVGKAALSGTLVSQSDAEPWRPQMGVIAMIAVFMSAVAAAAFLAAPPAGHDQQAKPAMITDPDLGTFAQVGPAWLYPMIREEPRDPDWAPHAEQALHQRYAQVPFFGTKPRLVRVTCARTLCEVAVSIADAPPNSSYGDEERSIIADMRKAGLNQAGAAVTGDTSSNRMVYVAYFMRAIELR